MELGRDQSAARVLLVDDEPLFVLSLAELLTEKCAPTVAATWGEAEALIRRVPWAGTMIDVCLRGRDGTELLPLVRRHHPQIPIVLMTGGDTSVCRAAYDHDAAFVPKPLPWGYADRFCTLVHGPTPDQKFATKLRKPGVSHAAIPVIVELQLVHLVGPANNDIVSHRPTAHYATRMNKFAHFGLANCQLLSGADGLV